MKKDYKLKKLFALFLAVAGILGIAMVGNAQDEAGKIFVKKTATKIYNTTATDNLEKGRFAKVNLSVNANPYNTSVTTNGKLDIVLIFDSSNSMDKSSGTLGETRMQAAKKAATNFANTLMDDKGTVKIGIVEFGTSVLDVQEMTTEKETVKQFIKNKLDLPENNNDGGTNLQAAIERADTVLNNGKREDAKQIVIVLTDGIPTYFTYNNNIYGTGQNDAEVAYNCNDYYCDWQRPSDAALKAMNKLKKNHSTSDVYTILFGNDTRATATLKKINPEQPKPLYKNYNALTGEDLKKMFETLSSQLMNIIGKDSVVTDIIPKEFMLTETSKNKLIEQGVEVKENLEDGPTELIWTIGNIEANKEISLTYEVKAKDEYHGSIFTNQNATLKTTVEENNPYYKNQPSTQTIVFEKPTVEIPAITNHDHYKDNSSYIGYAENVIKGTSILNNDLNKIIKNDKTKENDVVIVKDEIVINETENVTKVYGETNKYQITKDGVLQGILTINEDGTFAFAATKNASGEIEFTYHIKSTINSHHETEFVYSNDSTVTLLVKERQTKSITGEKIWKDENNNDGIRPTEITVNLLANNQVISSQKVTASNNWYYEFNNLYMYEVGHENEDNYLINYTVKEENVPGYTTKITGTTITNTHEIDKTAKVTVEKVWKDNNNQDGLRQEIEVSLLANGEEIDTYILNANNNWKHTFDGLQKYSSGKEIKYTIEEKTEIEGYTVKIAGSAKEGYVITNSHNPITIDIVGEKVWLDNNNNDNSRPESITVKLFANEKEVKSLKVTNKTVVANNPNTWLYEFKDLPKYENGKEINYTVKEENVPGYTTKITGTTITNTHEIDKTAKVTVEKVWKDNNNQDGLRQEIEVSLLANGEEIDTYILNANNNWKHTFDGLQKYSSGKEIKYTIEEKTEIEGYTVKIAGSAKEGYVITNSHNPITIDIVGEKVWLDNNNNDNSRPESITVKLFANEKEVKSLKVTNKTVVANNPNTWLYEFKDLPKYENGKEINYTVKEEKVNNYETSYNKNNKFIIINTHENEQIKLSGTKTWNDNNNQDGIRPTSIEVTLIGRVGEKTVYTSEKIEVSADTNWTYEFEKLDKFYEGKEIIYSVIEENVKGYSVEYNGLDIINTHIPEVISITGEKVWDDSDNQDGIRPEKITVILNKTVTGNTTKVAENIVEEDETGNWTFTFENLPKYENGKEISYTLEEVDVNGYTSEIKDYKITNTHAPETVTFNIVKEWYDYENNDGIRPNSITVRIKADHEEVAKAILSEENNWNAIFENLPKYKNGIEINYEIVEDEVEGYTPTISNPIKENDNNVTVVIKNTHEKETTEIVIEKVWDDVGNENKRPDSITVNIYANGELFETVKITAENNWQLKLENLQKYFSGEEIIYTIEEVELEDYVTDYEGYTIINSYKVKGEITPPNTGIIMNTNSKNLYIETLALLLGTISITYIFKKREN